MNYFDTSYLVRLYYHDPGADEVRARAAADHGASAAHGLAEMFAAFHRKLREADHRRRMRLYSAKFRPILRLARSAGFPKTSRFFIRNRHVYRTLSRSVFLGDDDAIHLATAAESGFPIVYSNVAHRLAAAQHFGIQGKHTFATDLLGQLRDANSP